MERTALRIALVAGEASGDILGGRVIAALRAAFPERELHLEGIGGAAMQAQGLESLYAMERLAVMGLEPLARLPELLRMRRELARRFSDDPPDLFLGIDAPDFNLGLARRLRRRGVRTAHLVSPTVWAWRPGRVRTVARSVDSVLCLFPFEPPLYDGSGVAAHFVGHPLVSELAAQPSREAARASLGLDARAPVIALLPGSRGGEVAHLAKPMLAAAAMLQARDSRRQVVLPAANAERLEQCRSLLAVQSDGDHTPKNVRLVQGQSREAMIAADVVILASGTASLEAMLLRRPMVIGYRVAALNWKVMSRLVVTPYVGLPNIFAGAPVVRELLQDALSPAALALAAEELLHAPQRQLEALAPHCQSMDVEFDGAVVAALFGGQLGSA